jgi:tRNA U38,U39,U40 pseudouridine synthase TruA
MNRRRRDRTSRAAAVIAVNIERRSFMSDQIAKIIAALAEMRRQADEFEAQAKQHRQTPCKSTGMPVCHGNGAAGAV